MGLAGSPQTTQGATSGSVLRAPLVICSHPRESKKDEQDRLSTMERNFNPEKRRPRVTAIFKHLVAPVRAGLPFSMDPKEEPGTRDGNLRETDFD